MTIFSLTETMAIYLLKSLGKYKNSKLLIYKPLPINIINY